MENPLAIELYTLCDSAEPDLERAEQLIRSGRIDLSAPARPGTTDCFLVAAIQNDHYRLARMLLENGADPDTEASEHGEALGMTTVFADLTGRRADRNELLKLLELLLEKGADPCGEARDSPFPDEGIFDMLVFDIFNDYPARETYQYWTDALIRLVAYGASSEYSQPEILVPLDKAHLERYRFHMGRHEDVYHLCGIIEDENGETVARI